MANVILHGSERTPIKNAQKVAPADPGERLEVSVILRRSGRDAMRARVAELSNGHRPAAILSREEFGNLHGA